MEKKSHWVSVVLELGLRQIDVVCQHDEYLKIRFQIGRSANPAVSFVLVITKREKTLQILVSEIKIRDRRKMWIIIYDIKELMLIELKSKTFLG